jgi:restriction endonuclease S subunit
MENISQNRKIDWDNLTLVDNETIQVSHFLKKGDILFCSRGANNYSMLIGNLESAVIAVSQFYIIRAYRDRLDPAYLCWYFTQPEAVSYFKSNTLMSTVPLINKKTLDNMPVPLPPHEKQKIIAEVYKLLIRENDIMDLLKDRKIRVINKMLSISMSDKESKDERC